MNDPFPLDRDGAATLVEDLFLTDSFLVKGRLAGKSRRLTETLESHTRSFLRIEEATMVALRGTDVIRTPSVLIHRDEIVLAHEFLGGSGDAELRRLAAGDKESVRIRAFYGGHAQFEITGEVDRGAYDAAHNDSRNWFVMRKPSLRGVNFDGRDELEVLTRMSYAILRKGKMAYIYDFA